MRRAIRLLSVLLLASMTSFSCRAVDSAPRAPHQIYVLVHGATGGGWDWRTMEHLLTADGHTVFRPTLTGLGEKAHLASPEINLTTHVNDIVNVILFENLHDVALVGHSYGGMVITGVMDRIPDRISHVIFLDAMVPDDGQSVVSMGEHLSPNDKIVDGMIHFSWLDASKPIPHDVPQSYQTYAEPVSYKNRAAKLLPVTYVAFVSPDESPEKREAWDHSWQRAKARGWTIRTLASDHNAQRSHPKELTALLEDALKDRNHP